MTLDPQGPFKRDPLAAHLMRDRLTRRAGNMGLGLGDEEVCKAYVRMSESSPYTLKLEEDFNHGYQS